jgi:Sec-independent protein translocase protein TatA
MGTRRASLEAQRAAVRLLSVSLEQEMSYRVSSDFNTRRLTQMLRVAEKKLRRCKKDVEQLERQLREETSARQAERERADLLQQQQHRGQESQTRLQQKAEELEKRLREQADVNTSLGRLMPEMRSLI